MLFLEELGRLIEALPASTINLLIVCCFLLLFLLLLLLAKVPDMPDRIARLLGIGICQRSIQKRRSRRARNGNLKRHK